MASTSTSFHQVEALTKNNYDTWCLQAQTVLINYRSYLMARSELLLLILPELKQIGYNTSKAVWDKLKAISGLATKDHLLKELVFKKMLLNL